MNFLLTELRSFGAVLREKDLSIVVSLDQFNQLPIAIKKTERPKLFHHRVARSPRVFVLLLIFSRSFFPPIVCHKTINYVQMTTGGRSLLCLL